MSSKIPVLMPETMKQVRDNFGPEFESLSDDQLEQVARLFGTYVYTIISHPDAEMAALMGPLALNLWLSNVSMGGMVAPLAKAGVLNPAKAAALVADIESKGATPEGVEHAKAVARGLWGKD